VAVTPVAPAPSQSRSFVFRVTGSPPCDPGATVSRAYCECPRAATGQITSTRSFRVP
jgi:hypothetical protein